MSRKTEIIKEIEKLEKELQEELNKEFSYSQRTIQKVSFLELVNYIKSIPILVILTSPIIYAMVIPAIILDIFLFIYQNICFRVYKIPLVKRSDYIFYDRQKLEYLNFIEKLGCVYCSYFNGLMSFAREVAGRTELYFCPIRHKKSVVKSHDYYKYFVNYGDANEYKEKLYSLRDDLRKNRIKK